MANFPAAIASIDKDKIVIEAQRGPVMNCVFVSGKLPRVGNKGVAVVDEKTSTVKFRGPRGAAYMRIVATS